MVSEERLGVRRRPRGGMNDLDSTWADSDSDAARVSGSPHDERHSPPAEHDLTMRRGRQG